MRKSVVIICLCFWQLLGLSQTQFNVRDSLNLTACVFKGITELDNSFLISGSGILNTDSGNFQRIFTLETSLDGSIIDSTFFHSTEGTYLINDFVGLNTIVSEESFYSSVGTFSTLNGLLGFVVNFNSSGDTISILEFESPYLSINSSYDFIAPLEIESTSNNDGTFFISSNIADPSSTNNDCYILKMSASGDVIWEYIFSTSADIDQSMTLIALDSGGVLAAIWQFGSLGAKLLELDANGLFVSEVEIDFITGRMHDMVMTSNSELIIASSGPNGTDGLQASLLSINLDGSINWVSFYGDDAPLGFFQEFTNIVDTQDGNYVVGGINYEYVETPTDTTGSFNENGWLIKVAENGEILWDRKYHFVNSPDDKHTLNDLKATCDGGYVFCGEATDNATGNPFSSGPNQQGWLVKTDCYGCLVEGCQLFDDIEHEDCTEIDCTFIDNIISSPQGDTKYFLAGPVPAGQFLNIYQTNNTSNSGVYEFYNAQGEIIESFSAVSKGTTMMLDVSNYPSGSYVLSLVDEGTLIQQEKIMVN